MPKENHEAEEVEEELLALRLNSEGQETQKLNQEFQFSFEECCFTPSNEYELPAWPQPPSSSALFFVEEILPPPEARFPIIFKGYPRVSTISHAADEAEKTFV